ncbi:hypothetical protein WJX72_004557 [[Myrmecia] bisecta]|uniref:Uncharacterized protein n=1 Tax=[Myrmecia] bisecta TaxID=41462 RepID=A0AAW1PHG9_9CHLO
MANEHRIGKLPGGSPAQSQHAFHGACALLGPAPDGEELFTYLYERPADVQQTNMEHVGTEIAVIDLHSTDKSFTMEHNGFQLLKLRVPEDIDWDDQEQVEARYYPEVEALLKQVTGATRVHIFDNTIRRGYVKKSDSSMRGMPVARVHVDYTVKSGPERLQALLPDEADQLTKTPFAVIQVWRPLRGPVEDSPLGMIDVSSVAKEDMLPYKLIFPDRVGYNYAVAANPNHRWYYAKGMKTDEAYVFVCYDSRAGRARFTPHTGFVDHSTPADAHPRESIEIRSYCFWEDEPQQEVAMEL